ncbi:hypothetical protein C476_03342 [Natrinema limicola JCM 13563]|uniref:Uncharacterized protein n=1 Tax=Natrinema limicola JCM 13563 TaxID=1230457 RepID=M0CQB5_9EURY|nr:hypothetical protein C476_03342 [Natrinema limicola JCM 13563]
MTLSAPDGPGWGSEDVGIGADGVCDGDSRPEATAPLISIEPEANSKHDTAVLLTVDNGNC